MKSGNLNFLEPSGPLQACNGTDLPFFKIYIKTLKTLLHVSITRSSSGSILCSLLKLQFKTLSDLLRYITFGAVAACRVLCVSPTVFGMSLVMAVRRMLCNAAQQSTYWLSLRVHAQKQDTSDSTSTESIALHLDVNTLLNAISATNWVTAYQLCSDLATFRCTSTWESLLRCVMRVTSTAI